MDKKFNYVLVFVALGAIVSCVPTWLNTTLLQYIVGVLSFVIILLAVTFFVVRTSEPVAPPFASGLDVALDENGDMTETRGEACQKSISKCWDSVCKKCNNVGFALFCSILLIVGIGVFDSLTHRDNEAKECKELNVNIKSENTSVPERIDTTTIAPVDTIK